MPTYKKWSAYTAAGTLSGAEVIAVVQSGLSRRSTAQAIANTASALGAHSSGTLTPSVDATNDLGSGALTWSSLFLKLGGLINWGNGSATLTHASSLLTLAGACWRFAAGTTAMAPAKMQSGTLLTTAEAGALEFDGTAFYATAAASARQVLPAVQCQVLTADRAGTDVSTAQAVFDASTDAVTLAAATSYQFEAQYFITRAAGTTSHTTAVLFAGTATFTSVDYLAQVTNPTGNVLANVQQIMATAETALTLTAANTSATENLMIRLTGTIRINAGGTLIPQFQYSSAPGGAPTIKRNSFFRLWPAGTNTVASVGNWS